MSDNDPPKNPFIRWKKLVDAHVGMTLNGLLGIPAMVNKNMSLGEASPHDSDHDTANTDTALDGVDSNQLLEWHKFYYYSPYSPLALQQQLPPPVPQDTPFGADPFAFTYADAFEDLLRASSGRPLLDLADRSFRNLRYLMRAGSAVEPPHVFFHRMHGQGLLDAYFPRKAVVEKKSSSSSADGLEGTANDSVVRAVTAVAEREPDLWLQQMVDDSDDHSDPDRHDNDNDHDRHNNDNDNDNDNDDHDDRYDDDCHDRRDEEARRRYDAWAYHDAELQKRQRAGFGGGSLFDELDRVFRVLGRIIDDETGVTSTRDTKTTTDKDKDGQPNAEDELYDAVRSAYGNAEKSLSTLIKTVVGSSNSTSTSTNANTDTDTDTPRETTQTEEHTDAFGNRHVKTVIRRVDADGNEVARETRYTVRSPTVQELAIQEADDGEAAGADEKLDELEPKGLKEGLKDKGEKPSGWFWK